MNEKKINLDFCPQCGKNGLQYKNKRHWICRSCDFDLYNNVAAAVGIVLQVEGKILFEKRAIEPGKGKLGIPGGFVDPDESLEDAIKRETKEEIGIVPDKIQYIFSDSNTYPYKGITYKTCDSFFLTVLSNITIEELKTKIKTQKKEVSEIVFIEADTKEKILKLPIAFESTRNALLELLK